MGRVNLNHSRRTNFLFCSYWIRDERNSTGTAEEWIYNNKPSGNFWAKQLQVKVNQENILNGVWLGDKNFRTIETDDDVNDLTRGSLIKMKGKLWYVTNVQAQLHAKESQFDNEEHYRYIISLEA